MKKTLPISLFLVLLSSLFATQSSATHVMGGDLTYKHLHDSTYELRFLLYRDCNSGQANIDANITYWVYYKKSKNIFLNNKTVSISASGAQFVQPEAPNCVTPSGVCIQSGEYVDTVTLGSDPDGYIVTWYRHERNHTVDNLKRCQSSTNNSSCNTGNCFNNRNPFGMVWTAEIPSYKLENSSPQFLTVPVPYFCTGITNSFNHVVFDPDGDSLVFKIVTPLSPEQCLTPAPNPSSTNPAQSYSTVYKNVVYQSGYSVTKPFGSSSSAISINSTTGEMKANPSSAGEYVIAVKIEEYRVDPVTKKTTYLGSIRRDLQFIAGACPSVSNSPPFFSSAGAATINVNPYDTIEFTVKAADNSDTVYVRSNGNIFGVTGSSLQPPFASFRDTQGFKAAEQTFFWVPTCDHITYTSPHIFTITLSDEGCNTVQKTYSVYVRGRAIYTPPNISCLDIVDNSTIKVSWDTLRNVQFFNGLHLYRVDGTGKTEKIKSFTDSTIVGFTDATVTNAQSSNYRYYLKIENSCGLEGFSSDSLSTMKLTHTEVNDKTVRFDWNEYSTGPVKYVLQQKIGTNWVSIDSTTRLFMDFSSCVLNTDFRVEAVDTSGNTFCNAYSSITTSTTVDNTPPVGAPTLRVASVTDWTETDLSFSKSSATEVTQYGVLRSENGGAFSQTDFIKSTASTIPYNDNSSLTNNDKHYCYKIVAQDSCGNAGDTSGTHCLVNLKVLSGQRESKLRWNVYSGYTIDSQLVERYDTIGKSWKTIAVVDNATSKYVDNSGTLCGFNYSYRITTRSTGLPVYLSRSDSESVSPKDTINPADIDILFTTNVDDTTSKVSFKKSTSADVNNYLIITLEYDAGGSLQSTDVYTHTQNNKDTFSLDIKTMNTATRRYCFGVIAIDSCGQNFSNNAELHCPVFLQGSAQNLSTKLNWSYYEGYRVDSYYVQTNVNGVWTNLAGFNRIAKAYSHLNVPCKDSIQYRIKALERGTGLATYSNVLQLTPFDTIKPVTPDFHFATIDNDTTVRVEWTQSASADVVDYDIFYGLNGATPTLLTTESKGTGTTQSYSHQGVNAKEDTFTYRIVAIDSCSILNRSLNNEEHFTVQLKGAGANQENQINWSQYSGFTVKEYQIETLDKATTTWSLLSTAISTDTSFVHQNVNCFDTITYRIKAIDNNTTLFAYSDTIKLKPFDTISPEPPVIQYVTIKGNKDLEISWSPSTSTDVNNYILYRKSENTPYQVIDTFLNKFSYKDTVNTKDSIWCYALKSIDSCAENASFKFSDSECTIKLTAAPVGCENKIKLDWNAYDWFVNGLSKYEVYRQVDGGAEAFVASVSNTTLTYTDNVSQQHKYTYRVKAIETGVAGFESFSQAFEIDAILLKTIVPELYTASVTETDATNGEIEVYWQKQEGQRYIEYSQLYYRSNAQAGYTLLKDKIDPKDSVFKHTGINSKTETHHYFLTNTDSCANISDTLSIHRTMDMEFDYGQLLHKLSWNEYDGFNVQMYILQQLIGGTYFDIDTIASTLDTFDRFPAPCNTVITYRIAAVNRHGHQAYSDTTSGSAIDIQAPDAPEINNVTVVDNKYIEIDFTGVDSLDTYGFSIDKSLNGGNFFTRVITLFTGQKQAVVFNDTTKLDSNYFAFRVTALDSCLNATSSSIFNPIALKGEAGNFENHLIWHPFKGYSVDSYYVDMNDGGTWKQIASFEPKDTSFTHTQLGCNAPVEYRIRANEDGGARATTSNWITLTPFDTISPSKPTLVSASVLSKETVEVSWEYPATSDIKYYRIYRSIGLGGYTLVDSVIRKSSYVDSVKNGTDSIYNYIITAIDSCNINHVSDFSDTNTTFIFTYERDTCDPTTYLKWTEPKGLLGSRDMFIINRSVKGGPFLAIDTVPGNQFSFDDSNVVSGLTYTYQIESHNSNAKISALTDTLIFKQDVRLPPAAPSVLWSTVDKTGDLDGETSIIWNKIPVGIDPHVVGYRVYWGDTIDNNYTLIGELNSRNDTSYTHVINTESDRNAYRVTAYNTCNDDGDTSLLNSPPQLSVVNLNLSSELSWTEYFGFPVKEYQVFSDVDGSGFKFIGSTPSTQFSFTDTTVGCGESIAFMIQAVSNLGYLAASDEENVVGFDTTLPRATTIQYVTVQNQGKELNINWDRSISDDAKWYTIEYKSFADNQWDTLALDLTTLNHTETGLTITPKVPYQFRVLVKDSCGNVQPTPTAVHHHLAMEAVAIGSAVKLEWMNYRGWPVDEYEVYRDNQLLQTISVSNARADSIFTTFDTSVACTATEYDYYVQASNKALSYTSVSNPDTAIGIDVAAPSKVYLRSASVTEDNTGVELKWTESTESDISAYNIRRKGIADVDFTEVKSISKDENATVDIFKTPITGGYCYQISPEDDCENAADGSNETCIMVLTGGNLKKANSIKWNNYIGWPDSVDHYEIYRSVDSTTWEYIDKVESRIQAYVDTNLYDQVLTYCYRVKAVEKEGSFNESAWSTVLCATQEPLIYIPNAFTPELSKGQNDYFGPQGAFVPDNYTMRIYSRWGQRIYETTQGDPWSGQSYDGGYVQIGTYMYHIEISTPDGQVHERTGYVKVIR